MDWEHIARMVNVIVTDVSFSIARIIDDVRDLRFDPKERRERMVRAALTGLLANSAAYAYGVDANNMGKMACAVADDTIKAIDNL